MKPFSQASLEKLASEVGSLLLANGQRLATAESCTGGWVAQCLTSIAGSSEWFDRGFIVYSNQAKHEMLGVENGTLEQHGAVSEAVAAAMAVGALLNSHADWSLSITGIAGPSGGSPDKPVGTVCFGWAGPDGQISVRTCLFDGSREDIRAQSVACALNGILERAVHLAA